LQGLWQYKQHEYDDVYDTYVSLDDTTGESLDPTSTQSLFRPIEENEKEECGGMLIFTYTIKK
jgi:hypothetical protein